MLIVNTDAFSERNLQKAGYEASPLADGSLDGFHVHEVALTSMTVEALKSVEGITSREAERSKNFFALGLMLWLYHRPTEGTLAFIEEKFGKRPAIAEANTRAFKAGYNYGETSEDFAVSYEIAPAQLAPGRYRQITGNTALELRADRRLEALRPAAVPRRLPDHAGLLDPRGARRGTRTSASRRSRPRTRSPPAAPRSARRSAARSASRPRPGRASCSRRRWSGLGVMLELPLLILDIQRAGPSTGMPTKPEQADLLMVLFGRNGESPVPGGRGLEPVAVLPRRDRGGPDRAQVPHARLPALRCGARERLRAVADPGRRRAAVDRDRVRDRRRTTARRSSRTCAIPRRWRAPWARAGHAGPRAPDRRAREGRRDRRDLLRPRQPRPDGAAAGPEGGEHRRRHPGARGRRRRRRRAHARARLGVDLRPDRRRRAARAGGRAQGRERAPPPPEPVPAQHGRRAAPLRQGARAGDEHGPAAAADPGRVPRRRGRLQPRPRPAVPLERARRGDHGAGRDALATVERGGRRARRQRRASCS